ncbi:MAG: CDP-glucose 4,6-dehydratase [Flavobacteriales bacterium]|jgi:CDP-glucose 4,6-dehydratase|nr:CDP-glucose 4,6-dehydratase [Flavobacteriales bacterium]MBT3964209.1 CDP-glucose 4,6-dehydratase [Flavobacteriales bacterium]MBT4704158.1 CDP-glucose 4,6-dehydratase [Flavobacteriales bacterium]MBT4930022.1 CDP-glucose 4,6-dehydratase [Flavobacteriales bacterium]MBT5132396.1 CDP-glucose 4,6-dehydratase [Flavobacteriales bacterium]
MDLKAAFSGKKVFLTGHTGFKGSWLLLILKELGAEVKGYSLAPKSSADLYYQIDGGSMCDSVIADIRDKERVKKELLEFDPDFVFHLAAQALVIDSYEYPVETFDTNVMGTIHVMDALRSLEKKCTTVLITTDKVYENFETTDPYPEDARLGGYDPYSNSKACAELAISSYRNSFFNSQKFNEHLQGISSARSGNVIGGGDWSANRLVPDIARALIANEPVVIRNPNSIRPWQHVLDPLNGYLMLAAALEKDPVKFSAGFNFGPESDDERNVLDMCELAIESWGSGSYESPDKAPQLHEAGLLKLAIDKAKNELGWNPAFDSSKAVEWTINWYRDGRNSANEFTKSQIREFFSLS